MFGRMHVVCVPRIPHRSSRALRLAKAAWLCLVAPPARPRTSPQTIASPHSCMFVVSDVCGHLENLGPHVVPMVPTWSPHGPHVVPTWSPRGPHVVPTWSPCGDDVGIAWGPRGNDVGPRGDRVGTTGGRGDQGFPDVHKRQKQQTCMNERSERALGTGSRPCCSIIIGGWSHAAPTRSPRGPHVVSTWFTPGPRVGTTWRPCGDHVGTTWEPRGGHVGTTWGPRKLVSEGPCPFASTQGRVF
jgi:hypothetical protein